LITCVGSVPVIEFQAFYYRIRLLKIAYSILFILILSPLPFGSVQPVFQIGWTITCCLILIGLYLTQVFPKSPKQHRHKSISRVHKIIPTVVKLSICTFYIVCIIQVQPIYSHQILNINQTINTIAHSPYDTVYTILQAYSYTSIFVLSIIASQNKKVALFFLDTLLHIIAAYAIYGFIIYINGNDKILWYEKTSSLYSLSSTFVNRNNFATYCGVGLILAVTRLMRTSITFHLNQPVSTVLIKLISSYKHWLYILELILLLSCLVLTDSRAGLFSTFTAILLIFILHSRVTSANKKRKLGSIIIGIIIITGVLQLSGTNLIQRFTLPFELDKRLIAYPAILNAITTQPMLGYGLGSFFEVFMFFRPNSMQVIFSKAHSDFLQLYFEAGVLAASIIWFSIIAVFIKLNNYLKACIKYRYDILSGSGVLALFTLHGLIDFPFQIPALGYTLSAILGFSLGIGWLEKHSKG